MLTIYHGRRGGYIERGVIYIPEIGFCPLDQEWYIELMNRPLPRGWMIFVKPTINKEIKRKL